MRNALHLAVGKPLGIVLVWLLACIENKRTVDVEVVELHVAGLACNLDWLLLYTVELTVLDVDVVNILYSVTANDENTIVALLAGNVFYIHIANGWFETTVANFLRLVIEVDFYYSFATLTYLDTAHVDVLNQSATAIIGLDAEDTVQMRRVHLAVFSVDILASAGNLRPDNHTSVTIFHLAVADDDIF